MKNLNKLFSNNVIFVLVLFVCFGTIRSCLIMFPSIMADNAALEKKSIALDAQIAQAEATLAVIEDPSRKSEAARAQYYLSEEGEIIFIFPQPDAGNDEKKSR